MHIWLSCNPGDLLITPKFCVENVFKQHSKMHFTSVTRPTRNLGKIPMFELFKIFFTYIASVLKNQRYLW